MHHEVERDFEMLPITWPEFANIHPFAPDAQTAGYRSMIAELEQMLVCMYRLRGGKLAAECWFARRIRRSADYPKYHASRGQAHRNICRFHPSAHGTNPASASMPICKWWSWRAMIKGNIDVDDLRAKPNSTVTIWLRMMITYPSTHGV